MNFHHTAKGLFKLIDGCDIAGFSSNRYDVPMLYSEFLRAGIIWDYKSVRFIDAGNIFKIKEERTLTAALKFYCGKELEGAHGAAADVDATINVLFAQLDKYEDIPTDLDELQVYCNYGKRILDISGKFALNDKDEIIINFGQNKGSRAIDEPGLMQWMINKDFAPDTLDICHQILNY
jgi:DNA polymerase-3 subunit epsilon